MRCKLSTAAGCSEHSANVSRGYFTQHTVGLHEGQRSSLPPILRTLCALAQPFLLADSVLLKAEITVYFEDSRTVVSMVTLS